VQANFGGHLTVAGRRVTPAPDATDHDGSCMIVIATDAPLDARQLRRLARRSFAGMARAGASFSHGSGDYAIAFSTALEARIPHAEGAMVHPTVRLDDPALSTLFVAAVDATQDAIYSALAAAETMHGTRGHSALAVPRSAFDEPGQ
jgi:D-aminopeptidase